MSSKYDYIPAPVRNPNNCHPDLIDNWLPPYGYKPSLAAGITFCILFGLIAVAHTLRTFRFRTWTAILLAIGALTETIGWAGRTWSAHCPYNQNAFLMQITTLIIGPTFFAAALYVLLGSFIVNMGRQSSLLSLYPESQPAGTWTAPLDMANWCNYLTFDIMSDVVFSAYYNLLGSDRFRYITDMISKSNIRMSVLVIIPWLTSFNFDHYRFKASIIARFRFLKFVIRCVWERVELGKNKGMGIEMPEDSVSGGAGGDVFEAPDTAKDSKTGESLKPDELASESITLIVADDDSLPSCAYLRVCIDEAMRMSPPNGAVLGREVTAPAGLLVDGSRVGTSCNTGVGIYAIHHDSRYYKDPFVYNPTRWLEDDGSGDSIERARYAFTPFSIGMRSCVGKNLAYHEIATTIGTILRRGDFCFADGELGLVGRGKKGAVGGRHRENEFQLHEHIAGHKNGPWLQFAPRGI
ncbi:hypothetical protein NM208_g2598 [Fusarium decemcellulare]|uniref:Uncharacterized protein n=2 Tax=Fusarium decemcellulare TaxID=57161 RepID=A0ACC1SS69_9HYPO|nr:hypothetical protein NM208_g4466 [Fusarium decemcellulare]KAJ3545267.1 hypothetical protein NM208_g2598 [Fusarium decemcellulare]